MRNIVKNSKFFSFIAMTALFVVTATDAFSQVKGKVRGGFDVGYPIGGNSVSGINLGYNMQNNMNIGIRLGVAYDHTYKHSHEERFTFNSRHINFAGFYNRYFISVENTIIPFVGGGFGLYLLRHTWNGYYFFNEGFGGFLTAGFEFWKFILTTEYNLLPTSKDIIGNWGGERHKINISNSYFAITAGVYIGGGNRKKAAAAEEREREEQTERERQETFSYFSQNYVTKELNQWLQKGEFERTDEWQQRISDDNRKAKEAELRGNVEQAYIAGRSRDMPAGNITLGAYNADNETFLIKNSIHGDWHSPVPVNEAPDFKNNWNNLVKTPQWVVRNDRIAFAGYTFKPAETAAGNNAAIQPGTSPAQPQVAAAAAKNDKSGQQGKGAVLGVSYVYVPGKAYPDHGVGAKFLYRFNVPVRLGGEFTRFLPETVTDNILFVKLDTKITAWEAGVNGHYLFAAGKQIVLYPSVGLGMYGWKGEVDVSAGSMGSKSEGFSEKCFVFSLGGGIDFALSSNLLMNAELRYKHVGGDNDYRASFTAGLAYRF